MKLFQVLLVFSSIWLSIDGLKVLGVLPFISKSHFAIGNSILNCLVKVGHEVTVISPYPLKKKLENYHDVDVSSVLAQLQKGK
jgi:glucuronosyltransferase